MAVEQRIEKYSICGKDGAQTKREINKFYKIVYPLPVMSHNPHISHKYYSTTNDDDDNDNDNNDDDDDDDGNNDGWWWW